MAMEQGPNRLERGANFFKTAKTIARNNGFDFNWQIQVVPDVGHEYKRMSEAAAKLL